METSTVTKATESEIIELINTHLPLLKKFDSIVADEEIGNQVLVVTVSAFDANFDVLFEDASNLKYRTRNALHCLAKLGVIPEGEYNIDCTW